MPGKPDSIADEKNGKKFMASGVTRRDVLRDLIRSGGLSIIIRACNGVLAYLMLLAVARSSSTADYGVFAVALSVGLTIATISEFGKPQTVTRFWPQWMGQNEPLKARAVLRQSALWVACSLGAATLLLIMAGALGKAVLMPWSFELAAATALLVLAYGWGEFASAGLRAQGYVVAALAPRDILWRLGPCLFFGWAALNRMSFDAETIMLIVAGILAVIVVPQTFWLLRSATAKTSVLPADDRETVLRFSLTVWATTSLQWLIDYGGVVIVSAYLGAEAAGGYFTAVRTAYLLSFFLLSIGMIMAPQISRHYHSDRKDLVEIIVGITGLVAGTTALAGIVFFFFFGDRILSLFNPDYGARFFPVLLIISVSQFFSAVSGPVAMMLTMSGHQQVNFVVGVSVGSAGIVAQLIGGYYYGAIGVATATAAAAILTGIIKLVYVWRVLGIDPTGVSVTGMALRRLRGILRKRRASE
jgi:O-antigen/teichoic acid export membrane protein